MDFTNLLLAVLLLENENDETSSSTIHYNHEAQTMSQETLFTRYGRAHRSVKKHDRQGHRTLNTQKINGCFGSLSRNTNGVPHDNDPSFDEARRHNICFRCSKP